MNGARFAARPIDAGGTPAATWLQWGRTFGELDVEACPALLVVAPHPDDETLGIGGAASTLRARGLPVRVVAVSDGGGAYPGLSELERRRLERSRRAELLRASAALGLEEPIFLGLPDGTLAAHEAELVAALAAVSADFAPDPWWSVTWRGDGHPDHEAAGRAVVAAAGPDATVLEYPVWMWHWAVPDDVDVPWHRMRKVPVSPAAEVRKQHAIAEFASQLDVYAGTYEPVLPPFVVQRLIAVGEAVFV